MATEIRRGVLLALAAAAAFGVTTPIVQRASDGAGPFATAAVLYAGAASASLLPWQRQDGPRLEARHLPRVASIAALGAFVAPAALVAGLARTSGTTASLLLNLEGVFTVVLGVLLHAERVVPRVWAAAFAIASGGAIVGLDRTAAGTAGTWLGPALVVVATLGWALDNALSRPLADLWTRDVVAAKGALGAVASATVALAIGEGWPAPAGAAVVLACGAVGYGGSLRLYLRAQRALGAARTGSVFGAAPFVGAALAVALGEPTGLFTVLGGVAMLLGLYLHLTEEPEVVSPAP